MTPLQANLRQRALMTLSPLALLLLWELASRTVFAGNIFIPPPSQIFVQGWDMAADGSLFRHVAASLARILVGFVAGAVPGVAIGLMMGMWPVARYVFDPLIASIYPIPKIALLPLLLMALGFGEASKITLVAVAAFFPIVINAYAGVVNIEPVYFDVARNFGAGRLTMFFRVVLLGALPMIFAGLRVALGTCFLIIVSAEFIAAKFGVGYLIWHSWELLDIDTMFVGIVVIGILGIVTTLLLRECERIFIPWKRKS